MDQILSPLPGILLRAIPTFLAVILLHWYLKKVLVQPLERVLEERRKKTLGTVESSEQALALVAEKLHSYNAAVADARAELFRWEESRRKEMAQRQAALVDEARTHAQERIAAAREALARETEQARAGLAAESDQLADRIASLVLAGGRAQ
jgi:F-type H+-transporting ATPase subunit b